MGYLELNDEMSKLWDATERIRGTFITLIYYQRKSLKVNDLDFTLRNQKKTSRKEITNIRAKYKEIENRKTNKAGKYLANQHDQGEKEQERGWSVSGMGGTVTMDLAGIDRTPLHRFLEKYDLPNKVIRQKTPY